MKRGWEQLSPSFGGGCENFTGREETTYRRQAKENLMSLMMMMMDNLVLTHEGKKTQT